MMSKEVEQILNDNLFINTYGEIRGIDEAIKALDRHYAGVFMALLPKESQYGDNIDWSKKPGRGYTQKYLAAKMGETNGYNQAIKDFEQAVKAWRDKV